MVILPTILMIDKLDACISGFAVDGIIPYDAL